MNRASLVEFGYIDNMEKLLIASLGMAPPKLLIARTLVATSQVLYEFELHRQHGTNCKKPRRNPLEKLPIASQLFPGTMRQKGCYQLQVLHRRRLGLPIARLAV